MNCRACGTQLLEGAAHCPRCGAATPYYYSSTQAAPDDPTVVSSPPPTGYGSPSYYNPYESYDAAPSAPPPPSPQRPRNRIGIIVGIVLLVLLLIGGSVFALLQYAAARNAAGAAAVATTTAQATATASALAARQTFTAKGTFTIVSRTTTNVRQAGQNKISSSTVQAVDSGDIMGSYTSEETAIAHPDNTANFSGKSTCTCIVSGKSGTLKWSYTGTQTADGSFQGQFFDLQGTGDLAKLHGQGVFQGQGSDGTYSSQLYFDA
jgi:hypothetical protein